MRHASRTIALTCLLALGAAACDGSTDEPPTSATDRGTGNLAPEAILQQASEDLAEQTVEARFAMTLGGDGESFEMTGDMAIDPRSEQAQMSFVYAGMPGAEGKTTMEIVVDGTTMYMRGAMLPDAGWLKLDADQAGMGAALGGSGQMDPSAFLEFLRGADGIEVEGTEDVRGHETTHFSGTIDPADFIAAAPAGEERDAAVEAIEGLEDEMGDVTMAFDAWVDAAGVPWRVSLEMSPDGTDAAMVMTFDILELGGDVEIEVPSGDGVTDLGSLGMPSAA
jgi:hypothetical protein